MRGFPGVGGAYRKHRRGLLKSWGETFSPADARVRAERPTAPPSSRHGWSPSDKTGPSQNRPKDTTGPHCKSGYVHGVSPAPVTQPNDHSPFSGQREAHQGLSGVFDRFRLFLPSPQNLMSCSVCSSRWQYTGISRGKNGNKPVTACGNWTEWPRPLAFQTGKSRRHLQTAVPQSFYGSEEPLWI